MPPDGYALAKRTRRKTLIEDRVSDHADHQTRANATGALIAPTITAITASIHVRASRLKSANRDAGGRGGLVASDTTYFSAASGGTTPSHDF